MEKRSASGGEDRMQPSRVPQAEYGTGNGRLLVDGARGESLLESLGALVSARNAKEVPDLNPLKQHPLFEGFPDMVLEALLIREAPSLVYESGEQLCRHGQPVDTVLFLVSGRARAEVQSSSSSSQAIVLDLLGPGSSIGVLSLVDGGPHSASVVAITRVQALALDFAKLRKILDIRPEWYKPLAEIAAQRVRNSATWLQALLS